MRRAPGTTWIDGQSTYGSKYFAGTRRHQSLAGFTEPHRPRGPFSGKPVEKMMTLGPRFRSDRVELSGKFLSYQFHSHDGPTF
jgi:hypothetical protein